MSQSDPPRPTRGASVTSLVDRLQPAQRGRHLATLSVGAQARDPGHLQRLTELAAHLETLDAAAELARLERAPRETEETRRGKISCRASLAAQRYLRGDAEGALADLAAQIAAHPEEAVRAHYFRSLFLELRGEIDAALADASRAITLAPREANAYLLRGEIHYRARQDGEALANFRRAAQLDPDCLAALSGVGVCLIMTREWEGAIPWLTRALRLHPKAHLRVERALCFERLERYDEALADLDAAIALDPDDAEALAARARCRQEGRLDVRLARALERIDGALALLADVPLPDAQRAKLHHERADALRVLGRHEDAAAAEARAVALAPDEALYWSWLGMVRAEVEGQAHLAEADVTRAIELAPADPLMRFNRAIYYEGVERWADALADLEQAVAIAPAPVALLHLHRGMTRWLTSDDPVELRRAMADYDRAIELEGRSAEALRWRAAGHAHFGDHLAALADLDRAVVLEPASGEAYHMRFQCRSALGDPSGARVELERAAAFGYPEAVEELRRRGAPGG